MVWLPDGEKNFEDIFIRFDATHERDRQTDGQTPHADMGRAYAPHRAAKIGFFSFLAKTKVNRVMGISHLPKIDIWCSKMSSMSWSGCS